MAQGKKVQEYFNDQLKFLQFFNSVCQGKSESLDQLRFKIIQKLGEQTSAKWTNL